MKKSDKIGLGVLALFVGLFLANIGYHVFNLEFRKKTRFLEKQHLINIVFLSSADTMLYHKVRIEEGIDYSNFETAKQESDFYEKIKISNDTLFIPQEAAYLMDRKESRTEYYIGLPNVKQLYWNGELVQRF